MLGFVQNQRSVNVYLNMLPGPCLLGQPKAVNIHSFYAKADFSALWLLARIPPPCPTLCAESPLYGAEIKNAGPFERTGTASAQAVHWTPPPFGIAPDSPNGPSIRSTKNRALPGSRAFVVLLIITFGNTNNLETTARYRKGPIGLFYCISDVHAGLSGWRDGAALPRSHSIKF